jgi:hypothetical protein
MIFNALPIWAADVGGSFMMIILSAACCYYAMRRYNIDAEQYRE